MLPRYDLRAYTGLVFFYESNALTPMSYVVWPQGYRNIPYRENKLARSKIATLKG